MRMQYEYGRLDNGQAFARCSLRQSLDSCRSNGLGTLGGPVVRAPAAQASADLIPQQPVPWGPRRGGTLGCVSVIPLSICIRARSAASRRPNSAGADGKRSRNGGRRDARRLGSGPQQSNRPGMSTGGARAGLLAVSRVCSWLGRNFNLSRSLRAAGLCVSGRTGS